MVLIDKKITEQDIAEKGVVSLPDKLTGTAAENKAAFDRLVKQVVAEKFNALIDALLATDAEQSGAAQIGAAEISGLMGQTVQSLLADLAAKALAHSTNANNPHFVTKAHLGLNSVDNTADLDKPISTLQAAVNAAKVDKIAGKGLSSEDYTTAEKNKLAGIPAGGGGDMSKAVYDRPHRQKYRCF